MVNPVAIYLVDLLTRYQLASQYDLDMSDCIGVVAVLVMTTCFATQIFEQVESGGRQVEMIPEHLGEVDAWCREFKLDQILDDQLMFFPSLLPSQCACKLIRRRLPQGMQNAVQEGTDC